MRRVLVTGASGNGKSTLGRALAERLDVPYTELDALHWGPGWTAAGDDEFRSRVEAVMAASDGWVIDGGYRGALGDLVWEHADTVVWLDQPLRLIMGRLWRRHLRRLRSGEELWNGNRETWRNALLGWNALFPWTVRAHLRHRREYPELVGRFQVVRLTTPREVQAFLDGAAGSGTA
ncbi:MAG: adenylate kinase [Gaiellaceae bacterium]